MASSINYDQEYQEAQKAYIQGNYEEAANPSKPVSSRFFQKIQQPGCGVISTAFYRSMTSTVSVVLNPDKRARTNLTVLTMVQESSINTKRSYSSQPRCGKTIQMLMMPLVLLLIPRLI